MSEEGARATNDARIAVIASRQHGVITLAQLMRIGVGRQTITRRVRSGRLHRIHRGVYAVGHQHLSERGRWMAAVLACDEGAVLSHLSAAELWGIRRRVQRSSETGGRGEQPDAHVTVPRTNGLRKRAGIVLHRSSTLLARQCTRRDAIPVTTPARTLTDLRPLLSPAQFSAAIREAEFLRLPIGETFASDHTRSELERAMLAICTRHRLPQPDVNVKIDQYEVDFVWGGKHLVVEVDGWESHRTRSAFEGDRARDARLKLLGYEVLRFTWRQLTSDPAGAARTIRAILRVRAP